MLRQGHAPSRLGNQSPALGRAAADTRSRDRTVGPTHRGHLVRLHASRHRKRIPCVRPALEGSTLLPRGASTVPPENPRGSLSTATRSIMFATYTLRYLTTPRRFATAAPNRWIKPGPTPVW